MTEYVTGQIYGWNGGDCPVHPKTKVEVWFRDGAKHNAKGYALDWAHINSVTDIIAFQVITPYAEPKVIWVNEYSYGGMDAYLSKQTAKDCASGHTLLSRTAVKYVEGKE